MGAASITYKGALFKPQIGLYFVDPDFVNKLGYHPFTGHRGGSIQGIVQYEWREGFNTQYVCWC